MTAADRRESTNRPFGLDAREFLETVIASGLLDREELMQAISGLAPATSASAMARHLVEIGRLTRFQAEKLLEGKSEGFLLGQYRIVDELGRGGMGRVYKAVHKTMGRFVALKILAPHLTRTERARELFEREVKAAARLNHPNIVTAYDANQAGDRFFLVMEYVDGPNLSQLVKERGPLPVDQACEFIRQAALGLDHAHDLGLIHRDVKPSNLLVQPTNSGPQVKILDFGLALVQAGELAGRDVLAGTPQTALGTPDYVAPEQARNHYEVDGRADLYSLGCTFYYLLTGQPPFPGGTALEKIQRHLTEAPVPVQARRQDVADEVAAIVHKLLAKNPKWRYQKASQLADDLAVYASKKGSWTVPPPVSSRRPDSGFTAVGEDPSDAHTVEHTGSTLPTAMMSTRETPASLARRPIVRRRRRTQPLWPWVAASIVLAVAVVILVGLAIRFLLNQAG